MEATSPLIESKAENATPYTGALIRALDEVAQLYAEIFDIISAEEKETMADFAKYKECFSCTELEKVFDLHTSLIQGYFRPMLYECTISYRLKYQLSNISPHGIEIGSNRINEDGSPKNIGVYLPLGAMYRWAEKLRKHGKGLLAAQKRDADTEADFKEDNVINTSMHKILDLIIMHIHPLILDTKTSNNFFEYSEWIKRVKIRCIHEEETGPTMSDALEKVKALMNGPLIKDLMSQAGFDIDEEQIDEMKNKILGDDDGVGGIDMEDVFGQLSAGELNSDTFSGIISSLNGFNNEKDEDEDSFTYSSDEDELEEDFEEEVRLEAIEDEEEIKTGSEVD